jgi:hypothetical protein
VPNKRVGWVINRHHCPDLDGNGEKKETRTSKGSFDRDLGRYNVGRNIPSQPLFPLSGIWGNLVPDFDA